MKRIIVLCSLLGFTLFTALVAQEEPNDGNYLPVEGGGTITIVGSRITAQHIEIVDRETIEQTGSSDITSLLQETLGLGLTRYGPYGNMADINIRGFNTKRIAIMVDGIPVNSSASGGFDFNSIDVASIERIEVIYGGSDTKFNVSGAHGGVINIVTVKRQAEGLTLSGSVSNTSYLPGRYNMQYGGVADPQWQDLAGAQNVNLSGAYGGQNHSWRLNVFGNRAGNNFLYMDEYGYARRKEGNEVLDAGISGTVIRELQDYSKLIFAGSLYAGNKNIPASGYTIEYAEQRDMALRESIMFESPRAFHDDLSTELSLAHNWRTLTYEQGIVPSVHNEHNASLINRWGWFVNPKLTLRFGADYTFISLTSTNLNSRYGNRAGLYLSSELFPVHNVLFIASLKGITAGSEIVPIPKLGFSWSVNNIFTIRNNYYRSFKFPDFNDLYWVQEGFMGNPDLKNEDSWGFDLGADIIALNNSFTVNSTVYGTWIYNSIHWNNSSGIWRPENYGTGAFVGWDTKLEYTLPFGIAFFEKPAIGFSWLLQVSWLLSGNLTFNDDKRIPYMPVHTLGASLTLPWKLGRNKLSGSLGISARFESVRYADTANFAELPSHVLLSIVYNQKVNGNTSIFARINNALNTHYVSFAEYPMPGISMTMGLQVSIDANR